MSTPSSVPDRARVVRWPAIALLAALLAVMVVVDTNADPVDQQAVSLDRSGVTTAGDADSLSSTWYCAAGTIVEGGSSDHLLLIANPSSRPAEVDLTVYPVLAPTPIEINLDDPGAIAEGISLTPPEAASLGSVVGSVVVAPRSVGQFRVAELPGVGGEHAAVLIESDVGDLFVEHVLSGPSGSGQAPCSSSSATAWYFAAGTTRKGAREVLSVFNPFPSDAIVDLTFATEAGVRAPQIYDGLVVPSGTVLPIDITGVVTLFESVSASLTLRTGRVVVDRVLLLDGSEGLLGQSVSVGSPQTSPVWVFPVSGTDDSVSAISIFNPSTDEEARVDVEISLDSPDFNGTVEPVGIGIRPGRTEIVVLNGNAELMAAGAADASGRILDGVGYWAAVRSINGVDVVAERVTLPAGGPAVSASASPGAALASLRHSLVTVDGRGELVLVNPAADRIAALSIRVMSDGAVFAVDAVEIPQRSRLVLDLALLGVPANSIVIVDASEPVFAERRLRIGDSGSITTSTILSEGQVSLPDLPLQ